MPSIFIPFKRFLNLRCDTNPKPNSTMSNFPPTLLFDILSRLSPKDLVRWLCVCKAWNSTILDQQFIDAHLRRSVETKSFRTVLYSSKRNPDSTTQFFSLDIDEEDVIGGIPRPIDHPMKDSPDCVSVLGHFKGVVCLRWYYSVGYEVLALWNPSIQRSERIPYPSFAHLSSDSEMTLNGHPQFGFGYDSVNDDFKIVGVAEYFKPGSRSHLVQIYSRNSKSWEEIQSFPRSDFQQCSAAMCLNGVLCWLIPKVDIDIDRSACILTLDLATEQYGEFRTPVFHSCQNWLMCLDVFLGRLCVYVNYEDLQWDAWMMMEFGVNESWSLFFSLRGRPRLPHKTLVISKKGTGSFKQVLFDKNGTLVWYDLKKQSFKKVESMPFESFNTTICTGSLCLLGFTAGNVRRQPNPPRPLGRRTAGNVRRQPNPPLPLGRRIFEAVKKYVSTWYSKHQEDDQN